MKINSVALVFILLNSLNTYCIETQKKSACKRRGSELCEILSAIKHCDREVFFKSKIKTFCSNYPGLENLTEDDISKIYSDSLRQEPIITILFLMSLERKEKHLIEYYLKGYNLNCHLKHNITLLHIAARYNKIKIIQDLMNKDADINAQDKFGNTPLSIAIHCKNEKAQNLLEQHGALKTTPRKSKCESCIIL